jgi:hypothetical protein
MFFSVAISHTFSSTSNAIDMESTKDWMDMYHDIAIALSKKVKVLIDLKVVKHLCHLDMSSGHSIREHLLNFK